MTILFVDLVGSSSLAEQFDPEDWKSIVDPALARFGAAIERNGGYVAQLLGDGVLAFFGAPIAHEDDAMRAVRAGLDVIASLAPDLPAGAGGAGAGAGSPDRSERVRLQARVGINSGEVIVGGVGGSGHREYLAVGEAVNIAARLQSAATPMTVLVAEGTFRRVAAEVDGRELGPMKLSGMAELIRAIEVIGIRDRRARGRPARSSVAFVGRTTEARRLVAVADELRSGAGGVVRISGEPGLGKTRLLAEWRRSILEAEAEHDPLGDGELARADPAPAGAIRRGADAAEPGADGRYPDAGEARPGARTGEVAWIEVGCRTTGRDLPYDLAASLVRAALRIPEGISRVAERRIFRGSIRDAVRSAPTLPWSDAIPLLAWLLDLPPTSAERRTLSGLEGRARQGRAAVAFRFLLEALARRGPEAIVIEDVHWIDPSSAELLAMALPAVETVPLLVVLTTRPEESPALQRLDRALGEIEGQRVVRLDLGPLDPFDQSSLAERLAGEAIPATFRDLLVERCEGNPLFIEELVSVLVERGLLRHVAGAGAGLELAGSQVMQIPAGLHSLLVARLDALPRPVRRLALIGAVVGRSASLAMLRAVATEAGEADAAAVADPEADSGGLLALEGGQGTLVSFRHALVHDAAYSLLAKAERRRLHGVVARRLELEATERDGVTDAGPTLARHFRLAGEHAAAVHYARTAAARAADDYANDEAIALYGIAIDATRELLAEAAAGVAADSAALRADLAEFLRADSSLLMLGGQYAESEACRREVLTLLPPTAHVERARALSRLADAVDSRAAYDEEEALLLQAEATLEAVPEPRAESWWEVWIEVRSIRVGFAYWLNRTDELATLLASLDAPVRLHASAERRAIHEQNYVLYLHRRDSFGPSEEVMGHARAAYEAECTSGKRDAIAWADFMLGFAQLFNTDVVEAIEHLGRALDAAPVISDRLLEARASTYLAIALRLDHREADTARMTERAIESSRRLGIEQYVAAGIANRAWLCLRAGDVTGARELAEQAEATWPPTPPLPLRWLGLWPAIAADAALGEERAVLPRVAVLQSPGQWPPAAPVATALRALLSAADDPAADLRPPLDVALARAREAGYL